MAMGASPVYSQNPGTAASQPAPYPLPLSYQNDLQPAPKDREDKQHLKSSSFTRINSEVRALVTKVGNIVHDLVCKTQEK
jgi:hypothetical protein